MTFKQIFLIFLASLLWGSPYAAENPQQTVLPLFNQELPNLTEQQVLMLAITYEPGASSGAHRHNASTFVYVLEGEIEMQIAGGELKRLTMGDTFYEGRDDVHTVSRNASESNRAKFLVFIVKDSDAPVSVPAD